MSKSLPDIYADIRMSRKSDVTLTSHLFDSATHVITKLIEEVWEKSNLFWKQIRRVENSMEKTISYSSRECHVCSRTSLHFVSLLLCIAVIVNLFPLHRKRVPSGGFEYRPSGSFTKADFSVKSPQHQLLISFCVIDNEYNVIKTSEKTEL